MKRLSKWSIGGFVCSVALSLGATASSALPPPAPDLEVAPWQGSMTPTVETTYQYTTTVSNIGRRPADGVILTITFPATNTSPTKYVLGKLVGALPAGCVLAPAPNRTKVTCSLGTLAAGASRPISFGFEFQVATTSPTVTSAVTTTSSNEQNQSNNQASMTPTLNYPSNVVTTGTYLVSSCTGHALTSYYECEISPGSIQTGFSLDIDSGGTLGVTGYPLYSGVWDQNTLIGRSLHFVIPSEVEFNGFAVSGTCFEGISTFPNNSTYNSAYRVCRQ